MTDYCTAAWEKYRADHGTAACEASFRSAWNAAIDAAATAIKIHDRAGHEWVAVINLKGHHHDRL